VVRLIFFFFEHLFNYREIVLALSLQDSLISSLWQFLHNIGPICGLKELLKIYEMTKDIYHPIFDLLQLFCNLCLYLST